MAVPSDPTVTSIVTDAMRHAGIFNPTTAQVTEMTNGGFQTVKTEIWNACANDDLTKTTAVIVLTQGSGQVNTPSDFSEEVSLDIYTGPESMVFTATAGASGTITAPSTFSADVSSIRGLYIFTMSGTGSGQYRQITGYNDTTKVVSITPAWTTTPSSDTVAVIGQQTRRLVSDNPSGSLYASSSPNQGISSRYRIVGSSPLNSDMPAIEISPVPDTANFAMLLTYIPNLTRLDETGTLFIKHLRERRFLWIDGIVEQTCRRYDEARYPHGYQAWNITLQKWSSHNHIYGRLEPAR